MVLVPVGIITLSALPSPTTLRSTTCSEVTALPTPYPFGPIVPFNELPRCASKCGPLFDAQGECSPPVIGEVDLGCFCNSSRIAALGATSYSEASNVCPTAQCSVDDMGLVMKWFEKICSPNSDFVFVTSTEMGPETVTVTATSFAHLGNTSFATSSAGSSSSSSSVFPTALAVETSLHVTVPLSTSAVSSKSFTSSPTSILTSPTAVKTSEGHRSSSTGLGGNSKLFGPLAALIMASFLL